MRRACLSHSDCPQSQGCERCLATNAMKGSKTTLSVHMGVCATRQNLRTALIDLDPQSSSYRSFPNDQVRQFFAPCASPWEKLADRCATAGKSKKRLTIHRKK